MHYQREMKENAADWMELDRRIFLDLPYWQWADVRAFYSTHRCGRWATFATNL